MSLKELKSGIINKDWDAVLLAYENMTGETLEVESPKPKKKPGRPKAAKTETTAKKKNTASRRSIGNGTNSFVDDGKLCREDKKIDALLHDGAERVERRGKFKPIKATCFMCNKEKEVNYPVFAESFRCDSCVPKR